MLSVRHLSYEIADKMLFQDLTWQLFPGESLQIEGANGSGKTTLLRLLSGLAECQTGEITWEVPEKSVCYIGHKNALHLHLTALENLKFILAIHGQPFDEKKISSALCYFQIESLLEETVANFSAGQMRRLALSKLLLLPAAFWLLDEPLNALDQVAQQRMLALMKQHLHQQGAIIYTTHTLLTEFKPSKTVSLC